MHGVVGGRVHIRLIRIFFYQFDLVHKFFYCVFVLTDALCGSVEELPCYS